MQSIAVVCRTLQDIAGGNPFCTMAADVYKKDFFVPENPCKFCIKKYKKQLAKLQKIAYNCVAKE